jgi:hypothetical protein
MSRPAAEATALDTDNGRDFLELLEALTGALEALGYFGSFWLFLLSPSFRRKQLVEWQGRSAGGKALGLLEAAIATAIGLGPFLLLAWWLM